MKNLIDTNVWIDAIAGNLSKKAFLKISVEVEWALGDVHKFLRNSRRDQRRKVGVRG